MVGNIGKTINDNLNNMYKITRKLFSDLCMCTLITYDLISWYVIISTALYTYM